MLIVGGLAVIVALTLATGYFVAQEFAYVAVDRGKLRQLAREGDAAAERALRVTSRLSFTLSGAQFGITLTALLVGFAGEPLLGQGLAQAFGFTGLSDTALLSISVAFTLLFSTALQMVLGELGPKNLAIARPVPLARALSRSTLVYLAVAGPVITSSTAPPTRCCAPWASSPSRSCLRVPRPEDLHRIISQSQLGGHIDEDLSRLLGRGLAFRGHVAEEAMTPRIDVQTVQADEPAGRVLGPAGDRSRSLPGDRPGHRRRHRRGRPARAAADRPGGQGTHAGARHRRGGRHHPRVPPPATVLERLRATHRQIAVVVDEYGGFAGVITFEDVAEEVVGEIWDEDDEHEDQPTARADGAWELHARLRMDEVEAATGIALPEDENYDTLSGLVMHRLGRMAQQGDSVEVEWEARNEHGEPQHCAVRIDVLSLARHVPELVVVHQMVARTPDAPGEAAPSPHTVTSHGSDEEVRG